MERKKNSADYTDQELLDLIDNGDQPSVGEHETDIPDFLSFYKIKSGKDLVSRNLVRKLYKLWSDRPVPPYIFSKVMNAFVQTQQNGKVFYYLLNQKSIDISKEAYQRLLKRTQNKTKIPQWKEHFDKFLEYYKIESGDYFLESYILYNFYDKFVYETKKKQPLGYNQFVNFCRLYFQQERLTSDKVSWFGVNESIKEHITDEQLEQLRKSIHETRAKKPKRNKKV